jgi:hypothetical protein
MSVEHKDKDYRCADKNEPANNPYGDGEGMLVAWRLGCRFIWHRLRVSVHGLYVFQIVAKNFSFPLVRASLPT